MSEDELKRLRELAAYDILDSASEASFDDIAKLAAVICGTPISLVSLIDEHRQWFKSHIGLDVTETPRDQAFCAHAIKDDEVMIVPDATLDPRFESNPLVTQNPKIRFYAGAPLKVASGSIFGTLCVIDTEPRELAPDKKEALVVLADAVVNLMELRRATKEIGNLEKLINICAWCRKVDLGPDNEGDSRMVSLEHYVNSIGAVSHGMCSNCENIVEEEWVTAGG